MSYQYKMTTMSLDDIHNKKVQVFQTLKEAVYHSYRSAQKMHDDVFMLDGKILNIRDDPYMYENIFNRTDTGEDYEHLVFNELPEEFSDRDIYDADSYDDLRGFRITSTPVDKIKERFDAGTKRVVVWAYNANDGPWPEVSYIENQN